MRGVILKGHSAEHFCFFLFFEDYLSVQEPGDENRKPTMQVQTDKCLALFDSKYLQPYLLDYITTRLNEMISHINAFRSQSIYSISSRYD